MENGKQPAYPIIGEQGFVELNEEGLTKREAFAMAAMQGMVTTVHLPNCPSADILADMAVNQADELLKALEK